MGRIYGNRSIDAEDVDDAYCWTQHLIVKEIEKTIINLIEPPRPEGEMDYPCLHVIGGIRAMRAIIEFDDHMRLVGTRAVQQFMILRWKEIFEDHLTKYKKKIPSKYRNEFIANCLQEFDLLYEKGGRDTRRRFEYFGHHSRNEERLERYNKLYSDIETDVMNE